MKRANIKIILQSGLFDIAQKKLFNSEQPKIWLTKLT